MYTGRRAVFVAFFLPTSSAFTRSFIIHLQRMKKNSPRHIMEVIKIGEHLQRAVTLRRTFPSDRSGCEGCRGLLLLLQSSIRPEFVCEMSLEETIPLGWLSQGSKICNLQHGKKISSYTYYLRWGEGWLGERSLF